jgi:hypothetical protein
VYILRTSRRRWRTGRRRTVAWGRDEPCNVCVKRDPESGNHPTVVAVVVTAQAGYSASAAPGGPAYMYCRSREIQWEIQ